MRYILVFLIIILVACSPAGYGWKIPPGDEARFKLDNYECDRIAIEAYPPPRPASQGSADLEPMRDALYKRCMEEKGYQVGE